MVSILQKFPTHWWIDWKWISGSIPEASFCHWWGVYVVS